MSSTEAEEVAVSPYVETQLKIMNGFKEKTMPEKCWGCPKISSQNCGEVKAVHFSSGSCRFDKFRDKRCTNRG